MRDPLVVWPRTATLAVATSIALLAGSALSFTAAATSDDGTTRVVGGREIRDVKDNPGAVIIHAMGMQVCTGSRIGPTWVLTARHCQQLPNSNTTLNVDYVFTNTAEAGRGPKIRVKKTHFAPDSDMMLIELDEVAPGPILPWSAKPLNPGDKVSFWGWGAYDKSGKTSKWLKTGESTVKSIDKAAYFGGQESVIQCAGSCPWSGDSGGPIIRDGAVVGDLSWSYSYGHDVNATAGYPATFLHAEWIQRTTGVAPDQPAGPGAPVPGPTAPGTPPPPAPTAFPTAPGQPQPQPTRPPRPQPSWPPFPRPTRPSL